MPRKEPLFGHSLASAEDRFKQALLNYRSQKVPQGTDSEQRTYIQLIDELLSAEQKGDENDYKKWLAMLDEINSKSLKERIKSLEKISEQMRPSKKSIFNIFKR